MSSSCCSEGKLFVLVVMQTEEVTDKHTCDTRLFGSKAGSGCENCGEVSDEVNEMKRDNECR